MIMTGITTNGPIPMAVMKLSDFFADLRRGNLYTAVFPCSISFRLLFVLFLLGTDQKKYDYFHIRFTDFKLHLIF